MVRLSDNTTPLPSKARDWDLGSAISTTAITGNISVAPKSINTYATEASDSDTWEMEAGTSHDEADEVTYSWNSSTAGGRFIGSTTSKTVQWEAPDKIGTYTLKCMVDDKALLGPLDTPSRDDDSQEETITVTVKRGWTPGTPIGIVEERDAAGVLIKTTHSGRMVAPQDQRFDDEADYLPLNPKVRVGTIVSCSVEAAVDMDGWTKGNKTEQVEDTADKTYTWSCTNAGDGGFVATIGATPTSTATGLTVKFKAPTTATPNGEHITLTCVVDDAPTAVVSPDSGSRDDVDGNILTRTVNIEAFNPSSWAEVKLYKYDPSESTPDHLGAEVTGDVTGGHLRAVVKVQVGGNSKLDDGLDASNEPTSRGDSRKMRLGFEECDAHHPEGTNEAAGQNHWNEDDVFHGGDWKFLNGTTWTTSTGPTAANNGNDPILYRRIIDWDTTKGKEYADPDKVLGEDHVTVLSNGPIAPSKLLGHNGLHRVLLVKEKKDEAAEAKFRTKTDGVYGEPFDSGPSTVSTDVQNLIIEDVASNAGNPDYLIYDPGSSYDELRSPKISFSIKDKGDPHKYYWIVYLRPTSALNWNNEGRYYQGIYVSGLKNGEGIVNVTWDGSLSPSQMADAGTYSFDLYAWETDKDTFDPMTDVAIDQDGFKSFEHEYHTFIPEFTPNGDRGHRVEDHLRIAGNTARAAYLLTDTFGKQVNNFYADTLNEQCQLKSTYDLPKTTNQVVHDQDIYRFQADEPYGMWRFVFYGEDSHGNNYRNQRNKRIVAVNQVQPTPAKIKQVALAGEQAALLYHTERGWKVLLSPTRKAVNQPGFDFVVYRYNKHLHRYDILLGDNKAWSANSHAKSVLAEDSKALSALFKNYTTNRAEAVTAARNLANTTLGNKLANILNNPAEKQVRRLITDAGGSLTTVLKFAPEITSRQDFIYKKIAVEVRNHPDIWSRAWSSAKIAIEATDVAIKGATNARPALAKAVKEEVLLPIAGKAAGKIAGKTMSVLLVGWYIYQAEGYQASTHCTNGQAATWAAGRAVSEQFFIDDYQAFVAWESERYDTLIAGQLRDNVRSYGNIKLEDSIIDGLSDADWPDEHWDYNLEF